jgi:hypothetical protein
MNVLFALQRQLAHAHALTHTHTHTHTHAHTRTHTRTHTYTHIHTHTHTHAQTHTHNIHTHAPVSDGILRTAALTVISGLLGVNLFATGVERDSVERLWIQTKRHMSSSKMP